MMISYGRKMEKTIKCPRCKCFKIQHKYFSKNTKGLWYVSCDRCRNSRSKTYICPHKNCELKFTQSNLKKHIADKHKDQKFECTFDDCKCSYKQVAHLNQHLRIIHEKSERFECPYKKCDMVFTQNSNLSSHIKSIHANVRDNICTYEDCDFTSVHKDKLKAHIESVHLNIIRFSCDEKGCKYKCYYKNHLIVHMKMVHLNIRDNICQYDDCSAAFSRPNELKQHVKSVHLNIRDYVCPNENCDYSASDLSNFNRHITNCTDGQVGSFGEVTIKNLLTELKIKYIYDKSYPKMTKQTKRALRFDFRIMTDGDPLVIEYDGKQHFEPGQWSDERFAETQESDRIKNEFCENNDILMLRIPYWDTKKIRKLIIDFLSTNTDWTENNFQT